MKIEIKKIPKEHITEAVDIFTGAFIDDPLFKFAFPELNQRKRLTKVMYEFVVYDMVPQLNLMMIGAYVDDILAGCEIYTTPEANEWDERMNVSLKKMRAKANDDAINLIGEYARLKKYDPGVVHFYGNEIAVKGEFRKKGIGKALADNMIKECKNHTTAQGIIIDTANENNIKLYEKWGWVLKGVYNFYTIKSFAFWRGKYR